MNDQDRRESAETPPSKPRLRKESRWECYCCGQRYLIDPETTDFENFICCICSHINCLVPPED